MARGPETRIKKLEEALTIVRKAADCLILQMEEPRRFDNTPPRPQNSLGLKSQFPPSGGDLFQTSAHCGPSRWSLLSPHYPAASYAWQLRVCGQGRRGLMGTGCLPPWGNRAQFLRPIWWRWRRQAGVCMAIWPAPGLMLRSRPCLTRAERTKRSGPVCARGSSRGRSGGPGAGRQSSAVSGG